MKPVVWTIAGTDPVGGAGIQADLATFSDLGVHGCSVITSVVSQNTDRVLRAEHCSPESIADQLKALVEEFPPRAIKIGMMGCAATVQVVADALNVIDAFVVCDPVTLSSSGAELLDTGGVQQMKALLFKQVDLLTPNMMEMQAILGEEVADIPAGAGKMLALGVKSILIKGGHVHGNVCRDYWTDGRSSLWLESSRVEKKSFRGTGCVLSSAIASCIARGVEISDALRLAKAYVNQGMRLAEVSGHKSFMLAHGGWPDAPEDQPSITR